MKFGNHVSLGLPFWLLIGAVLLNGCDTGSGGAVRPPDPPPIPVITGLSVHEASVGDPVSFSGDGFVERALGWVDVHFVGEFVPSDGSASNPVDLVVPLRRGIDGRLTWERFGDYRVPFVPAGNKLGQFVGEVYAENNFFAGATEFFPPEEEGSTLQEQDPLQVTFHVLPSLVVLDNRAFGDSFVADCVDPAVQVLEVMRYGFRVKALGFQPARFEFSVSGGLLRADQVEKTWVVSEQPSNFGFSADGNDEFALVHRWTPTPQYVNGYSASIGAKAVGIGIEKSVLFPFIVRPWSYPDFDREPELAELLQPQPVSGCIPGGPASLKVAYRETRSETRSRSLGTSLRQDVEQMFGVQHTESYEYSETVSFSETESREVSFADTTFTETFQNVTDLFSATGSRTRTDSLGWEASSGGLNIATSSTTGIDTSAVRDFTTRGLSAEVAASLLRAGVTGSENYSNNYGPETTRGINETQSVQLRDRWESSRGGEVSESSMNSRTRGRNYQVGSSYGRSQTYEETFGLSQTRTLEQQESYGQSLATSQQVSEALGTTEEEILTQSSSEEVSVTQDAFVWAGLQGMWYRQTARIVSRGAVVAHDLCGNSTVIGEVAMSEWEWAADLGIGEECPPPTNLPPAQCRIPPCTQ